MLTCISGDQDPCPALGDSTEINKEKHEGRNTLINERTNE